MKKAFQQLSPVFFWWLLLAFGSCRVKNNAPSQDAISSIELKKGDIILCGPPEKEFGTVSFTITCSEKLQNDFNLGVALLHSFEYDEAEKSFARIIEESPGCVMAYWGVAMSNYHPLWAPPSQAELKKGAAAIAVAQSLHPSVKKESAYIDAIGKYYYDWEKIDHHSRCLLFEKAMEKIYLDYPGDKEAAIFYSLSLDAAADPSDKTYAKQRKAGDILNGLYPGQPTHPGILHYIIHSYDYPELAELALPAARKYATIAPSSAHALHMPSHIFTRLGLWDECIQSNIVSTASAKCYAQNLGIKGHWDEELHGLDYLVYAYLQEGDNTNAKAQCNYLDSIQDVSSANFKVAYAFAAIPARYVLENKLWKDAAALQLHGSSFPWEKFPWQKAIFHFTRLLGAVHTGNMEAANTELKNLHIIYDTLIIQKDDYKAKQVLTQIKTSMAWISFKKGNNQEALNLMQEAVNMEENTEKHPVTPCEVLPARELLADMYMQMNQPVKALACFELDLKYHPKRFNGLYGAAKAAEQSNDASKAHSYYQQLITMAHGSTRPELEEAKKYME